MIDVDATMEALQSLQEGIDLRVASAVCEVNPLLPGFAASMKRILHTRAESLWIEVQRVFTGAPPADALRQAWSSWPVAGTWTGLLFSAASRGSPELQVEAHRLRELMNARRPTRWARAQMYVAEPLSAFGLWLLADEPAQALPVPDLGSITGLRDSARLRFHLAHAVAAGESLASVFRRTAFQPGPSDGSRRAEFLRALRAMQATRRGRLRLAEADIAIFGPRELHLLRGLQAHWPAFVAASLHGNPYPAGALNALCDRSVGISLRVRALGAALRRRDFSIIENQLDALPRARVVDSVARATLEGMRLDEADDERHPTPSSSCGPWRPLAPSAARRIEAWRGRPLPAIWTMSAEQVGAALTRGELREADGRLAMTRQDFHAIRREWTPARQLALIRCGLGVLVDPQAPVWRTLSLPELARLDRCRGEAVQPVLAARLQAMPDARPWLRLMAQGDAAGLRDTAVRALSSGRAIGSPIDHWERFVASAVGTPEWEAVRGEAIQGTRPIRQVLDMLRAQIVPVDAPALRLAVARALHDPAISRRSKTKQCLAWLERDPLALPVLAMHAPQRLLMRIAVERRASAATLETLQELAPAAVQRAVQRARRRRTSEGT